MVKEFIQDLSSNSKIVIEENNLNDIEKLKQFDGYHRIIKDAIQRVYTDTGIEISQDDHDLFELFSIRFNWTNDNDDNNPNQYLYGSFFIADMANALRIPSQFWKVYNDPQPNSAEESELQKLACFQRSAHGDDGTFGCFYREPPNYPCEIYFYDNGAFCPMNLTLREYFETMLHCKAVVLWQYFYIEPQTIVKMLDGLHCNNWISLYDDLEGNPTRVEGVIVHMERVIRLFPGLFPDHDLTFFKSRLDKLKNLVGK